LLFFFLSLQKKKVTKDTQATPAPTQTEKPSPVAAPAGDVTACLCNDNLVRRPYLQFLPSRDHKYLPPLSSRLIWA